LKIVRIQVIPPQIVQVKTWRKFSELSVKTDEVHFGDHWHILLARNIPLISKGGLEHMMGLCEVCALVASQ
jgi:hypothetical protein